MSRPHRSAHINGPSLIRVPDWVAQLLYSAGVLLLHDPLFTEPGTPPRVCSAQDVLEETLAQGATPDDRPRVYELAGTALCKARHNILAGTIFNNIASGLVLTMLEELA